MVNNLVQTIEQISKEKGIQPEVVYRALEDAMVAAARKYFKTEEDLHASFDPETGQIEVFAVKEIVETVENPDTQMSLEEALKIDETFEIGDVIEIPKPTLELGRIAAQTAKQVIVQKVREAEREIIHEEFSEQIGTVVNGIIRRFEGRDIILDVGRTEAILPLSEQSRNEQYNLGDRIRAVIINVHRLSKGPQIVVSRTDPRLLMRLFEAEIPEVYDGTVVIKNAVREGGERAKVAVASRDSSVDPVGACVGMKGSRINAVIRELRGEKIDIINYSDDVVEYAVNALSPARISRVLIADPVARVLEVIVPEDQLSLAIGRKGQNVRLASRLIGWEIDIKSEEAKRREVLEQMNQLEPQPEAAEGPEVETVSPAGEPESGVRLDQLPGCGEVTQARLEEAGIRTVEKLAEIPLDELMAIPGIGEKTARRLKSGAQKMLGIEQDVEESTAE
jgi:N utilization substance protein A